MMEKIAKGERPAFALDSIISKYDTVYPRHALQMYFTSNHDENSWNQADFGDFPGPVHAPFAVFTQTMPNEIPLIYSGQEEPILWSIKFFDKDTLVFRDLKRALFYQALLSLRKRSPALAAYASFRKLEVGNDQALYAFVREKAGSKVVVILNLSNQEQPVEVRDKTLWGHPYNVFMGKETPLNGKKWLIGSWGYAVYEYGK
jgi:glycosidase